MYCIQTCNIFETLSLEVELFFKSELHIARCKQLSLAKCRKGDRAGEGSPP